MWIFIQNENDKLKEAISKHPTYEELAQKFRITPAELALRLHQLGKKGYLVFAEERDNKTILIPGHEYIKSLNLNPQIIVDCDEIQILALCDAHAGHRLFVQKYLDMGYNFMSNNKISYYVDNGDMIHGVDYYVNNKSRNPSDLVIPVDRDAQIEYVNKIWPYDPSITHLFNSGNHERHTESGVCYDFMSDFIAKTGRDDIRIIGFGDTLLKINNDGIRFCHGVPKGVIKNRSKHKPLLVIYGGSHVSDWQPYFSTFIKVTPPISDLDYESKKKKARLEALNGAVDLSNMTGQKEYKGVFFPGFTRIWVELNSKRNIENIHLEDYRFNGNRVEAVPGTLQHIEKYRTRR